MIRRFGEPIVAGQRYGLRPGAYGILMLGNRVLVTHQTDPKPEYQLPGGGIDPGESPIRALHREVFEETGWSISDPRRVGAFRRFAYMPEYDRWAEKLCTIYRARPVRRLGPPTEPGHRAVWLDPRQAAALLGNEGDRHFLLQVIRAAGR
ncbi:NUDIX hydrolase [Phaeovulum sp.]|uniref:NUDIX hydrolase n=1 Tax=Phaeovulum sp. TaxID=2934796 RepID=UPI0039E67688